MTQEEPGTAQPSTLRYHSTHYTAYTPHIHRIYIPHIYTAYIPHIHHIYTAYIPHEARMAEARGLPNLTLIQEKTKTHSCLTHWFSVVGLPLHAIKFAKKKKMRGGRGRGRGGRKTPLAKLFGWTGTMK